ncbi:MAG TPA: ribosome silencing factor [Thermoanaerobaculia bacterium]|jgi:ribosome-associated protein|nr:ribosome silencing factor [Thermoanaerobaculia bacterium]
MTGASSSKSQKDNLRRAVEAADQRKAIDLRVLDLRSVCDFTDYFVIASGSSQRQVQAIATAIEESLGAAGVKAHHVEGASQGRWVLLDYGDFVAHIFDEDRRRYYRLEDIWSDAPDVTDAYLRDAPAPAQS